MLQVSADLEARARLHSALAEPARLAIVDELAWSDRSPSELARSLQIGPTLLAHHLDTLESVGLVERVVSSSDRRRRYVRLLPAAAPAAQSTHPPLVSVLFVCTRNSARSQLAAALWSARVGGSAESAGIQPADRVHPGAVAAGRRVGLDLSDAVPRTMADATPAVLTVTVCDHAHETLDAEPSWWHWSIPDPIAVGTRRAFDKTVAELTKRIDRVEHMAAEHRVAGST